MSVERSPFDTEPVIEVVSEDVILPVAESSVFSRTREEYLAMSSRQRKYFWAAVEATALGVAFTTAAFVVEERNPSSKLPMIFRAAGYACDYADELLARHAATELDSGSTTEFGAIADPLADKYNNTLNEIALVRRGKLSGADLAIRATRDVGITAARRYVTKATQGRVDVKANKFGKMNTVVRDGVNLFASTQTAEDHPRISRTLHTAANAYSVASAVYTATQLKGACLEEATPQARR